MQILKAINKQKILSMGMTMAELICSCILGGAFLMIFNLTLAMFGCVIGYSFGNYLGKAIHNGIIQRWMYWNFPLFKRNKYLPDSHIRNFM